MSETFRAQVTGRLDYDPETGSFTWIKPSANSLKPGDVAGYRSKKGYIRICVGYRTYLAHHLAWLIVYGRFPDDRIDHINGDPSDNRIANLRLADAQSNGCNRGAQKNNKIGIKGVSIDKKRAQKPYLATINWNGKQIYLGNYAVLADAIEARRLAEKKYFGEFARAA